MTGTVLLVIVRILSLILIWVLKWLLMVWCLSGPTHVHIVERLTEITTCGLVLIMVLNVASIGIGWHWWSLRNWRGLRHVVVIVNDVSGM